MGPGSMYGFEDWMEWCVPLCGDTGPRGRDIGVEKTADGCLIYARGGNDSGLWLCSCAAVCEHHVV